MKGDDTPEVCWEKELHRATGINAITGDCVALDSTQNDIREVSNGVTCWRGGYD